MTISVFKENPTQKIISILKLLRIKHYVKNLLIFFPLIFSRRFLDLSLLIDTVCSFAAFSCTASAVYIVNDIRDVEKDRTHPTKCERPIASGTVSVRIAAITAAILLVLAIIMNAVFAGMNLMVWVIWAGYLVLNLGYSFGLKNIPVLDIAILASGFFLRLLYGSFVTGIQLSPWLYLTTVLASFYLGFGKRRNEYKQNAAQKRDVLDHYNYSYLDKCMNMCMTIALVFYSLWAKDVSQNFGTALLWTVPFLLLIVLKYNLNIEKYPDGDPVEVIFSDRILLVMILIFMLIMFAILYF